MLFVKKKRQLNTDILFAYFIESLRLVLFQKQHSPKAKRMTDISGVNKLVRRKGFEPYTEKATYFLQALNFKRTLLLNEKVEALAAKVHMGGRSRCREKFPKPILKDASDVDAMLQWDQSKIDSLKSVLADEGGDSIAEMVRLMMKRFMTNELMATFNRTGTDSKKKFSGSIEDILKDSIRDRCAAVRRVFDGREIEKKVASVLKRASDQCGQTGSRKARKPAPEVRPK